MTWIKKKNATICRTSKGDESEFELFLFFLVCVKFQFFIRQSVFDQVFSIESHLKHLQKERKILRVSLSTNQYVYNYDTYHFKLQVCQTKCQ